MPLALEPGILTAARCLALDHLASETARLLADSNVPSMLLKGPATAARLSALRGGQRRYSDVDLLVAPDCFGAAQDVLHGAGYRSVRMGLREDEKLWHERPWRAPDGTLMVDLHRGFAGVDDPDQFWTALWNARDHLDLSGHPVAVPGLVGTALIIALHAGAPGSSEKPSQDLLVALSEFSLDTWSGAAALARAVGAASAYRAGIELLPAGSNLARRIGLTVPVTVSSRIASWRSSSLSLSVATGLDLATGQRVGYAIRRIFPSAELLRVLDPSARPGRRGLTVAYLRRWSGALIGAPAAISDITRARRSNRPTVDALPPRWTHLIRTAWAARRTIAGDPRVAMTFHWSVRVLRLVRAQLSARTLAEVDIPAPPGISGAARSAAVAGLRLGRATCLERSLVLQRFHSAGGAARDVLIAVTPPVAGFRAHAWLDGEKQDGPAMTELVRHSPPGHWLPPAGD